jgi:hypothetical protein
VVWARELQIENSSMANKWGIVHSIHGAERTLNRPRVRDKPKKEEYILGEQGHKKLMLQMGVLAFSGINIIMP